MRFRAACWMIALGILCSLPELAAAQSAADPKKWSDNLFETLLDHGSSGFFDLIKRTSVVQLKPEAADDLQRQTEEMFRQVGTLGGYEYVAEKKLGSRLRKLTYVIYAQRFPIIYDLAYYKNNAGWQLFGMSSSIDSRALPWQ